MKQTYYNPQLGRWIHGEITKEEIYRFWQIPGPATSDNIREWADNNQYGFYRKDIMICLPIDDMDFDIRLHCICQTVYGKTYVHENESEILKIDGKPLFSVPMHKKIVLDEYSYPYIVSEEEYDTAILDALKDGYGILSAA